MLRYPTSLCLVALVFVSPQGHAAEDDNAAALFGFEKIHDAHLIFAPDQWDAIKPDQPEPGPGGFGRPGGPGGGGPMMFSPGGMLVPGLLRSLDADKDGKLPKQEFTSGFERLFAAWDAKQQGYLDGDAIRDGMNKDLAPSFGPPPGAAGAPEAPQPAANQANPTQGGPRPPQAQGTGGGPPGMQLQGREGKRNGLSSMMGVEFEYVHADLEFAGRKFTDVAVRYKGNGTYMDARNSEKKSFKVDLNEFVKGQKLRGLSKLNFHNNITDAAWMNESLAYELYRQAGVPAPRTSFMRMTVTVPGKFDHKALGLYSIVENLDTNWAKDRFDSKKGLILKPVTRELFVDKGSDWSAYRQAYDAKTDITDSQMRRVMEFAKLVTSASDEEFAAKLPEFLDIDEFSRFMAVTVWLSSTDSILMVGQNYVVYLHPETKKFLFAPWDLDRAFGNFFTPNPEQLSLRKAWAEDNRFLQRVMNVPSVRDAYLARVTEFQSSLFEPGRLSKRIDEIAAIIRSAVEEEGKDKLERFEQALSDSAAAESPAPEPGRFPMPRGMKIKNFIKARHQSVADQLAGKSEGQPLTGGFGRPPGGGGPDRQGFGVGRFLGAPFAKMADADANGQISSEEFQALAQRWFSEWDADADGTLTAEQLRDGLAKAFPAPNFNGPPRAETPR